MVWFFPQVSVFCLEEGCVCCSHGCCLIELQLDLERGRRQEHATCFGKSAPFLFPCCIYTLLNVKGCLEGDCASKVSLSLLFYICIYCIYLGFFIIIDVLFSNEVSFNVSIGFWSLNELFQKIQRRNSEQRIEEKFS